MPLRSSLKPPRACSGEINAAQRQSEVMVRADTALCDAKIRHLHLAIFGDDHVLRLNVA